MVFSIAATFVLVLYQRHVIRLTNSVAIRANSIHYVSDLLVNGAVIAALLLWRQFGWALADPIFGAGIGALYPVHGLADRAGLAGPADGPGASRMPRGTGSGRSPWPIPWCASCHDLRTRSSGQATFIQFHLELDGAMALTQAHAVSDEVEDAILMEFPGAEIIIHEDPAGVPERRRRFG